MFGENPNAVHVVRFDGAQGGEVGFHPDDEAFAHQHARVTDEYALPPPANRTYGYLIGTEFIPRYVPKNEDDAQKGGRCARCGRRCPAHALRQHEGKRQCTHCRALRQGPNRADRG